MIRLILLAIFFLMPSLVGAQAQPSLDLPGLVAEANKFYAQGSYKAAAELYTKVLDAGLNNPHIHYNAGNAHYQLSNFGLAIAHYRQALKALPRNADVRANLELARKETKDRISDENSKGLSSLTSKLLFLRSILSEYELKRLFLLSYTAFWILVVLLAYRQAALFRHLLNISLFCSLILSLSIFAYRPGRTGDPTWAILPSDRAIRPGVITSSSVTVRSGDSKDFPVIFQLSEGAEIETLQRRNSWVEIELPSRRRGWLQQKDIMVL